MAFSLRQLFGGQKENTLDQEAGNGVMDSRVQHDEIALISDSIPGTLTIFASADHHGASGARSGFRLTGIYVFRIVKADHLSQPRPGKSQYKVYELATATNRRYFPLSRESSNQSWKALVGVSGSPGIRHLILELAPAECY
jgi:hypothetical protein